MIEAQGGGGIGHYTYNLCEAIAQVGGPGLEVTLITKRTYELAHLQRRFRLHAFLSRVRYYPVWVWRLVLTLALKRPDVVHIQSHTLPVFDAFLIALIKVTGLKVIFTAHDVLPHDIGRFDRRAFGWIYSLADRIIVHADGNRTFLVTEFGVPTSKVKVIPHGNYSFFPKYNGDRDAALREIGCPENADVVLFFGFITRYKGLASLIRAMALVIRQHPNARLVIAGKPDEEGFGEYDRQIDGLGLRPHITTCLEYIPFEEVTKYFAASRLVALPYVDTYQSGVVQVAYACARPVVATSVGGLAEVVTPGITGDLVPPADDAALAESIASLLSDKHRLERMGTEALRMTWETYSWQNIASSTVDLYKDVSDRSAESLSTSP